MEERWQATYFFFCCVCFCSYWIQKYHWIMATKMAVFIILQVFWYELTVVLLSWTYLLCVFDCLWKWTCWPGLCLYCCVKWWHLWVWNIDGANLAVVISRVSNPETQQKLQQDVFPCRTLRPYAVVAILCVLKTLYLCFLERTREVAWDLLSRWFVSLQTIQSDPRLISSKRGWGGSTHGFNPAKSTQWALTSFCSFPFSFITLEFLSLAFAPTLYFPIFL